MSQTIPSVYGLTKDIIKVDKTKWTHQQRTTKKKDPVSYWQKCGKPNSKPSQKTQLGIILHILLPS